MSLLSLRWDDPFNSSIRRVWMCLVRSLTVAALIGPGAAAFRQRVWIAARHECRGSG